MDDIISYTAKGLVDCMRNAVLNIYIVIFFISCIVWLRHCHYGKDISLLIRMFHTKQLPWLITMLLSLVMTFVVRQSTVHYGFIEHFSVSGIVFILIQATFFLLDLRAYTSHMEPIMENYLKEHPEISEEEAINNSEIFSELDRTLREKDGWIKFGDIIDLYSPIMKNIE